MEKQLRESGIPVIGDVPWGTHFCQFYKTKGDLIDILVPYFKAGLENHEFCMWVTSEPLTEAEAREAMRYAVPDFDQYVQRGQIEIVPHDKWYLHDGVFGLDRVLSGWIRKLQQALSREFDGMRVTGNTAWLEKKDWKSFTEYEEQVNSVIGKHKMISLCSYCLDKCGSYEIIEVISNHEFALIRREGEWCLIESSERKRMEEELRRSRDLLDRVLNGMHEGVMVVERGFAIVEVNDCFLRQHGISREKAIGRPCHEVIHWLDKPCPVADQSCPLRDVFATGRPVRLQHTHRDSRGKEVIVELSAFPLFDQDGNVELMVEMLDDITERKRAEEYVKSLAKFPSENPDPIFRVAADGTLLYANAAGQPLLADWNCGVGQLVPERWCRLIEEVFASGAKRRVEEEHAGRVLSFDVVPIAEAGYVNLYGRDITERRRAEEALRLSHRLLVIANRHTETLPLLKEFVGEIRNYTGCAAVGIRLLDEEGNIPYQAYEGFSERFYELESPLSIKSDRCMCINVIKGETDPKLPFYTEGGSFYMNGTTRFLATVSQEEKGHTRNTCNEFGYESVALIPIRLDERLLGLIHVADTRENMVPLQMVTMLEDAAMELGAAIERLKAQEALAAEKERLSVTLRSIGDGVIVADTEGKVVLMNQVAEQLTGWTFEEAAGKPLADVFYIINEDTRERCENPVEKVLQTGRIAGLANRTVLVSKNGTERFIADSGAPIRDDEGDAIGVILVFRDMTEKRRAEQELLRAEKMESVGVLAGGIAHDFNNILTLILGNISLAKTVTDAESKAFELLAHAEKACWRARDLTQQLLTFAKGGAPVRKTITLSSIIRDATAFALSGSNVRCDFAIPERLWPVEADEGQIGQVVNNLVINADQAMPSGGLIRVSAENVGLSPESGLPIPSGKYVKLAVRDQGIGISREHLPKIFDPYFTTKQKGSGLGLATAYSVIKNHDGHITVESQLGVGSTFFIYLPASEKEIQRQETFKEKIIVGQGKVLVMDDEEAIRQLARDILTPCGYQVVIAKDGAEAIELFKKAKKSRRPFHAVILDLTVPGGMGGKETIEKLLAIDRNVKAIVSSGYSNDPIMADFGEHGFRAVVAKPYDIRELAAIVHHVISGEPGNSPPL